MVRSPIIEETIFVKNVCSIFFINSSYFAGKDIGISSNIKINREYFVSNEKTSIFANLNN